MTFSFETECTDEGDCQCEVCIAITKAGITDEMEKEFMRDMIEARIGVRMILVGAKQHGFDLSEPVRAELITTISESFDVECEVLMDGFPDDDDDLDEVIVPLTITSNRLH